MTLFEVRVVSGSSVEARVMGVLVARLHPDGRMACDGEVPALLRQAMERREDRQVTVSRMRWMEER